MSNPARQISQPDPTTWEECRDAGMCLTAAARLLGKTISAGSVYAKRHGFKFPADPEFAAKASARMKALHADPEFAAKASARMKALHADPEFAAKASARMKALNADPEFAAKASARMKALHADPEFAAKASARMKALNADPEFNPLASLIQTERADYDILVKKGGLSRHDALVSIGRSDLIARAAE